MLQPVPHRAAATHISIAVQDERDGLVADRMDRELYSCRGVLGDHVPKAFGVRPEWMRSAPAGVELAQPCGSGVDHAIAEDLDQSGAPASAAARGELDELGDSGVV